MTRRCRVHRSADNLMSLAFSESWWLPNWNMLNRCKSHFHTKKKKKEDWRSSGVRRNWQEPKSERSYWLDQRQLLMFEKKIRFLFYFFFFFWMSKDPRRIVGDGYGDHVYSIDRRVDQSDWAEWMMVGRKMLLLRYFCYHGYRLPLSLLYSCHCSPQSLPLKMWQLPRQCGEPACPQFTDAHCVLSICIYVDPSTHIPAYSCWELERGGHSSCC